MFGLQYVYRSPWKKTKKGHIHNRPLLRVFWAEQHHRYFQGRSTYAPSPLSTWEVRPFCLPDFLRESNGFHKAWSWLVSGFNPTQLKNMLVKIENKTYLKPSPWWGRISGGKLGKLPSGTSIQKKALGIVKRINRSKNRRSTNGKWMYRVCHNHLKQPQKIGETLHHYITKGLATCQSLGLIFPSKWVFWVGGLGF